VNTIDYRLTATVREALGSLYGDLLGIMRDLSAAPLFFYRDKRPRLVQVRDRATEAIRTWAERYPTTFNEMVDLLPRVLALRDSAASLVEAATWDDYFAIPQSAFTYPRHDSPVLAAVPRLATFLDDHGLIDVADLDARPHGLFIGPLSVHYHQFLRRGFTSNVHYELVEAVVGIARLDRIRARIAIDDGRIRYRDEHLEMEERDYWYGPTLTEEALDDPQLVGETVHGDPELGQSILSPYAAVCVRWTRERASALKTVEIEELVPVQDVEDHFVLVRYLHSIRDMSKRAFIHCDGAVKAYDRDTYPRDLAEFRRRAKAPSYRKVFRLDGAFSAKQWSTVAALWFRGNRLVPEYLMSLSAYAS